MNQRAVTAENVPAVAGPYSHAVIAGDFIFLAGQGPVDPETGEQAATFEEQARQTLTNLAAVAAACGASLKNAVRVGVFLRDMADFPLFNEVYREFIREPLPARTTVPAAMPIPIEIDAVLWTGGQA
jgi:2-iminobutanoate/2-iminopropanoate deaminase